jgi:hypothetical protein
MLPRWQPHGTRSQPRPAHRCLDAHVVHSVAITRPKSRHSPRLPRRPSKMARAVCAAITTPNDMPRRRRRAKPSFVDNHGRRDGNCILGFILTSSFNRTRKNQGVKSLARANGATLLQGPFLTAHLTGAVKVFFSGALGKRKLLNSQELMIRPVGL